ncbi:MAG: hypothetical protein ACLR6Z_00455 [Dorea sp.]
MQNPKCVIGIHNHPTNILPTGSDFVAAGARKYEFGIIATHDGRVFSYKVGKSHLGANISTKPLTSMYQRHTIMV